MPDSPLTMLEWQYRTVIAELQNLQLHVSDPTCPCSLADIGEWCIPKHVLTVASMAGETMAMDSPNADMWAALQEEATEKHLEAKAAICREGEAPELLSWGRDWRKRLEVLYYVCKTGDKKTKRNRHHHATSEVGGSGEHALVFPKKSDRHIHHINKAEGELGKAGVTFDTGTTLGPPGKPGERLWELERSLKGAHIHHQNGSHVSDIKAVAAELAFPRDKEAVHVVLLDKPGGKVLSTQRVSSGDGDSAPVPIPDIMAEAKRQGARAAVLVHNHPSGNLQPSAKDILVTQALRKEGHKHGVELVDHMIVNAAGKVATLAEAAAEVGDSGAEVRQQLALWPTTPSTGPLPNAPPARRTPAAPAPSPVVAPSAPAPIISPTAKPKLTLFPFQQEGVAWLQQRERALLADDMGLGKTPQAIHWGANRQPALVVVPAAILYNWASEIQDKWRTGDTVTILDQDAPLPRHLRNWTLVTYDQVHKYLRAFQRAGFRSIIIDEAHKIKNLDTKRTQNLLELVETRKPTPEMRPIPSRLAVTGTPIMNRPPELFPLLVFLGQEPYSRAESERFATRYTIRENIGGQMVVVGYQNLEELHNRMRPFTLRRLKKDVLTQLPPKIYRPIYTAISNADEYHEAETNFMAWLEKTVGQQAVERIEFSVRAQILVRINHLRKLAAQGKVIPVRDFLKPCDETGHKVIAFSEFVSVLETLHKARPNSLLYTGATPKAQREAMVRRFQTDPAICFFFGTTGAAGVGITLTAADRVVFNDLPWTPGGKAQAEDRAHRIGQKKPVEIVPFLAKGTIDERIMQILAEKERAISQAIDGLAADAAMQESISTQLMAGFLAEVRDNKVAQKPPQYVSDEMDDIIAPEDAVTLEGVRDSGRHTSTVNQLLAGYVRDAHHHHGTAKPPQYVAEPDTATCEVGARPAKKGRLYHAPVKPKGTEELKRAAAVLCAVENQVNRYGEPDAKKDWTWPGGAPTAGGAPITDREWKDALAILRRMGPLPQHGHEPKELKAYASAAACTRWWKTYLGAQYWQHVAPTAPAKVVTVVAPPLPVVPDAPKIQGVENIALDSIIVKPELYQYRRGGSEQKGLDKERVLNIVKTFDPNLLEPVEVRTWDDIPVGKYELLGGHHRLEVFKQARSLGGFPHLPEFDVTHIPALIRRVDLAMGRELARRSNSKAKKYTASELAMLVALEVSEGREMEDIAKRNNMTRLEAQKYLSASVLPELLLDAMDAVAMAKVFTLDHAAALGRAMTDFNIHPQSIIQIFNDLVVQGEYTASQLERMLRTFGPQLKEMASQGQFDLGPMEKEGLGGFLGILKKAMDSIKDLEGRRRQLRRFQSYVATAQKAGRPVEEEFVAAARLADGKITELEEEIGKLRYELGQRAGIQRPTAPTPGPTEVPEVFRRAFEGADEAETVPYHPPKEQATFALADVSQPTTYLDRLRSFNDRVDARLEGTRAEVGAPKLTTHPIPPQYAPYAMGTQLSRPPVATGKQLTSPAAVAELVRNLQLSDRERLIIVFVNVRNRVIGIYEASVGTQSMSLVPTDAIARAAILANASGFFIVHNHPGGDPTPSKEDDTVRHGLESALRPFQVTLLDSIIIGGDQFWSWKANAQGFLLPPAIPRLRPTPTQYEMSVVAQNIYPDLEHRTPQVIHDVIAGMERSKLHFEVSSSVRQQIAHWKPLRDWLLLASDGHGVQRVDVRPGLLGNTVIVTVSGHRHPDTLAAAARKDHQLRKMAGVVRSAHPGDLALEVVLPRDVVEATELLGGKQYAPETRPGHEQAKQPLLLDSGAS